jgi:polar amino acid transport system substrate-binding protein
MSLFTRRIAIGSIAALLLMAGCQAASSPSASVAGSAGPSATANPTPVASVPTEALAFAGKLTVCIDIPYPPQEFFDASGNPTGSDVDIATEIAHRLGLEARIENSVFSTIIAAVTSGKCDIIVSAQNITADRLGSVNMIPYFQAGQSFVVSKGNPKAIKVELDLCGKKAAAETGTTEADYINGTGDYKGAGLNKKCTDASKPVVNLQEFEKDSDALLALSAGQVDAYFADSPVAGYYAVQQPNQFELSGVTVEIALEGISVPKDATGSTVKRQLADAIVTALKSMIADSTYMNILNKYGDQAGAVDATAVQVKTGS